MLDSSADRDPLDRLAEEFVDRLRGGEHTIREYAARLPDRTDEVRDLFPALVEMEHLKPESADRTGAFAPSADPSHRVRRRSSTFRRPPPATTTSGRSRS